MGRLRERGEWLQWQAGPLARTVRQGYHVRLAFGEARDGLHGIWQARPGLDGKVVRQVNRGSHFE